MSFRQHRRDDLGQLISDLEVDIRAYQQWAAAFYALAQSDLPLSDALQVMAEAMDDQAKRVVDSWEAAFALSCYLRRPQQ